MHWEGPLLLAANHPNSFLDGIVMATLFKNPVYSLARGDVFRNKNIANVLRRMFMLPVYRTTEGVENLTHNYTTFASCRKIFEQNGIVLMFSEGGTKNEWHLRPLRKGTARLAITAWNNGIDLMVVPLSLNYSSFRKFGKVLHIYFGDPLIPNAIINLDTEGKQLNEFNIQLRQQLKTFTYEIDNDDRRKRKQIFFVSSNLIKTILLLLPGIIGLVVHAPLYLAVLIFTNVFFNNDHYDSIVISLLVLLYPLYLLILTVLVFLLLGWIVAVLALLLLPFSAWALTHVKHQFDFN